MQNPFINKIIMANTAMHIIDHSLQLLFNLFVKVLVSIACAYKFNFISPMQANINSKQN